MADINKLKIAELRKLCTERGLNTDGLPKTQLKELLTDSDNNEEDEESGQNGVHNSEPDVEEDDAVEIAASTTSAKETTDSMTILELKLKLQIVEAERLADKERFEREREKRSWGAGTVTPSDAVVDRNISSLLPTMLDSDVLSFFHSFEKTCELNGVD